MIWTLFCKGLNNSYICASKMKLLRQSYYLLIFSAISLATVFFMKINKQIFYSHYFKVIEEVELRNSQEVKTVAEWSALNTSFSIASAKILIQHLFAHAVSDCLLKDDLIGGQDETFIAIASSPRIYQSAHPARAP